MIIRRGGTAIVVNGWPLRYNLREGGKLGADGDLLVTVALGWLLSLELMLGLSADMRGHADETNLVGVRPRAA